MPRLLLLEPLIIFAFGLPLGLVAQSASAGHPMLSEDTGTQGRGNFELELGNDWTRSPGSRSFLFQPQLSLGASPTLDWIVQPSWTAIGAPDGTGVRGLGDTNLDAKWRFYGAAPWSLGVRAGLGLPTGEAGLSQGRVVPHVVMVATADRTPWVLNANVGYSRVPGDASHRADLYHLSAAATVAASERLFVVVDAAADSDPDATRGSLQVVALIGVIYTVRPGLDVDIGYRRRLSEAGPARQWLLGITIRGSH